MKYKSKVRSLILPALAALSVIVFFECAAQTDTLSLSKDEINEIITKVDTLSGDRNYHVLLKKEEDNHVFQVHIWINSRLGGTMFKEVGMNICQFYPLNNSSVFVYANDKCENNVPAEFIRKSDEHQYSYLTHSPFFVENGFYRALLVKKAKSGLEISELELVEGNSIELDLEKMGF
ncbi:MAG: hypothetical protein ABJF04_09260 [Reichenbachiella sp.]|uniref:hypothetical protein n=1 Tax=Reichenbachiella sp. TaxID=2184521 RepID=UPI003265A849